MSKNKNQAASVNAKAVARAVAQAAAGRVAPVVKAVDVSAKQPDPAAIPTPAAREPDGAAQALETPLEAAHEAAPTHDAQEATEAAVEAHEDVAEEVFVTYARLRLGMPETGSRQYAWQLFCGDFPGMLRWSISAPDMDLVPHDYRDLLAERLEEVAE